jgi:hypothetical protein
MNSDIFILNITLNFKLFAVISDITVAFQIESVEFLDPLGEILFTNLVLMTLTSEASMCYFSHEKSPVDDANGQVIFLFNLLFSFLKQTQQS